jgi:hypothetical protein
VRRNAEKKGGAAARVPRVPVRRQWPCTFSASLPVFCDRARRPWTIATQIQDNQIQDNQSLEMSEIVCMYIYIYIYNIYTLLYPVTVVV